MPHQYSPAFVARFWSRVDKSGDCWLWTGACTAAGYGSLTFNGERLYAHHVAWELAGMPRSRRARVLHTCDLPACLRNDEVGTYDVDGLSLPRRGHLFGGTQANNIHDAVTKRRMHYGDAHGSKTHPESTPRGDQHAWRRRPELVRRGEDQPMHKVTESDVREMRRMRDAGALLTEIGARFPDVQIPAISRICNRVRWKHIE